MHTKSQRSSSFLKIILFVGLIPILSQIVYSQSVLSNFGVEIGGGYNQYFLHQPNYGSETGQALYDRSVFFLTPEVRIKYDILITDKFTCIPFVGYNRYGGKSNIVGSDGWWDAMWFDALEVGFFTTYTISNISFGIGYKANRNLKVTEWSSFTDQPLSSYDVTDYAQPWSHDAGLRISYRLSHYSISSESWFGISELSKITESRNPDGGYTKFNTRENHFRLLLGYTL